MKVKKKKILFLAAFLLLIPVLAGLWCKWKNSGSDKDFAIRNSKEIGRIFLADRENNTVLLERKKGNHWIVNGKYPADQSAVEELLRTLRLLTAKAPVPESAKKNVIKGMAVKNTRVEVFDRNGRLLKAFYVGAPAEGSSGNYMLLEGSDNIYVVHIPGLDAMLQTRFFTDLSRWRDRSVFRYPPGSIRQVELRYPSEEGQSFGIEVLRRDSFRLYPLSIESKIPDQEANPHIIARYLNAFREINAEAYLNAYSKKDSILATPPYATITVEDTAGRVNEVKLFYKAVDKRTKMAMDSLGRSVAFDRERSYALVHHDSDFVLIQHFVFGKLLMRYDYFFKEEGEVKKRIK